MNLKKLTRNLVFLLFLWFLLVACEPQNTEKTYPLNYYDATMGTSFTVKASFLPYPITSNIIKLQIKNLLHKLDGQFSTYKQDSELVQFNLTRSTDWQTVSSNLHTVLTAAAKVSALSQGAFDVTVAPLVNLWGFGAYAKTPISKLPTDKSIKLHSKKIGFQHLLIADNSIQIRKEYPELMLDLSAIAKGYAVDQVALLLEQQGIADYMVEIGGELRLKGKNIHGQPWRIAVEKPTVKLRVIQKILPLTDIALATSGNYRIFLTLDGVRFSHTIDPQSGMPITHKLASVTVLNKSAMIADAWATALMVLGYEKGIKIAEKNKLGAIFIVQSDDGFVEKISSVLIDKFN